MVFFRAYLRQKWIDLRQTKSTYRPGQIRVSCQHAVDFEPSKKSSKVSIGAKDK